MWHSVFRLSWSVWTKCVVAWSCAQEWRARDRCGREGNKRLLMSHALSPSTAPTCAARQLQCRTAGGGKSLIIACLPQCQVHLPLPNHKPALARLAALQKNKNKRELIYWHVQSTVRVFLVRSCCWKWGGKKYVLGEKVKNMQPNRVYIHPYTFFTFQSTL